MVETKEIDIFNLEENTYNPNKMSEDLFSHLTETIDTMGFLQQILVWKRPSSEKKYIIIDGAHRYRSLKKLGYTKIEAKILNDYDLLEIGKRLKEAGKINVPVETPDEDTITSIAKALTILMNEIKGELNPVKFAKLLNDLKPTFTTEQISMILNKPQQELESYELLLNMEEKEALRLVGSPTTLKEMKFILTDTEMQIMNEAIKLTGIISQSEAATQMCMEYIGDNNGN